MYFVVVYGAVLFDLGMNGTEINSLAPSLTVLN